ncbi:MULTISPECIES: hypothetical protein [unclassified Pseudomonas]|uniref:hypothetical protein n=1 Tax=Pseudomonas TaxID=286 RepID=UPI000C88185E|nr:MULTISPECIES: hypothetical protein [unclassified Pseudomonas]PNA00069.1 hypothetical protein C1X79_06755 [Pseudomonas sp. FW305-42]PNA24272.1 hypothetical protein C1X78_11645 [Pseudomonas sp. MPR-R1B]PNB24936.1 hypothetical protein C1X80_15815 [Pseudomonas sp. DP16D-E2]PNB42998.1 hypothetical protein C1X75_13240 [Pseudomonas sp. FW305-17]PNB63344.1 hypothetical protein C1X77_06945 [Pseudomonas sp. GW531-E2]
MDRGFNLSINTGPYPVDFTKVHAYKDANQKRVDDLAQLMIDEDTFDASLILEALFPAVKADIFLSHSSADANEAIQIALELQEKCGLNVFIDSCVWGSIYDLLKAIDKYRRRQGQIDYDYDERNRLTAHIHMILTTALQRMIDQTDTIIFMNTEHSISLKHSVNEERKTLSPWIHMELNFSTLVRRRSRYKMAIEGKRAMDEVVSNEHFNVVHDAPTGHLTSIAESDFRKWMLQASTLRGSKAIDLLYRNF